MTALYSEARVMLKHRGPLRKLILVAATVAFAVTNAVVAATDSHPNVVLIMADDK